MTESRDILHVMPGYQPVFREVGLDADLMFSHPDIKPWRELSDRQNCVLDVLRPDGSKLRFHVKRYYPSRSALTPAAVEEKGHRLLVEEGIPTADLVAWGKLTDGRSFTIFADLTGYQPSDKLIQSGAPFARLLEPTADLAAKLHMRGLHHRDLYLCHFFAKIEETKVDLKLIDVARVARLGSFLTRRRWIVKDLAQFWYSTIQLPVTDAEREAWLARYAQQADTNSVDGLRKSILRKVRSIARHDVQLRRRQPTRNISLKKEDQTDRKQETGK